jgi:phosphatidylglycerol:prolipoprotein diacylglycerol transferase
MYVVAFAIAYGLFIYQVRRSPDSLPGAEESTISGFFTAGILGLILGARIIGTTVYVPGGYYLTHPWFIFWPFDETGAFVGYQGMSYHGGLIGTVLGTVIYCRRKKLKWLAWADTVIAGIPLGYTFGRLGNFINGELWGRVTSVRWGMIFPLAPGFPVSRPWVREMAGAAGLELTRAMGTVNLPRHPSQLYEAFFEGIFVWGVLWFIFRPRKKFHGALFSLYLVFYGLARFFIEYTREPDGDMGFPIELVYTGGETARLISFFNFSTGQIFSALMIIFGLGLYLWLKKRTPPLKS